VPHVALLESGLSFVAIRVDEASKVMSDGAEYRAINPLGYLPAWCSMMTASSLRPPRLPNTSRTSIRRESSRHRLEPSSGRDFTPG